MDRERHRLGHAVQGEIALHFGGRAILELGELALVGGGGKFLDVEEVGRLAGACRDRPRRCTTDAGSMVMSTVPVLASRSSTILPAHAVNLPRHTDMPPK